jgi:hypothetical protein
MKSKSSRSFKHNWLFYLIALFIIIRALLNISLEPLFLGFLISYIILFLLLIFKFKHFPIIFILFLYIDSLIGTYLFTSANNLGVEFYGTILINAIFIILTFYYKKK